MLTSQTARGPELVDGEWITFPGGELEGRRPKALCLACREALRREAPRCGEARARALCFQCYHRGLARGRALQAAGQLDTACTARFQFTLPFEPVNLARLERLRGERASARAATQNGTGRFVDQGRHAQIAARRALREIIRGLRARGAGLAAQTAPEHARRREQESIASAIHAAELQLPESWLAFVVSR